MSTAFRALHEGVVLHDASGRIFDANPAAERILSLSRAQLLGRDSFDPAWRSVDERGSPLNGEDHPAMLTLRTGVPQRDFIMGVYPGDAHFRWIRINTEPFQPPGDQNRFVVATFVDITAQKKAQAALQENTVLLSGMFEALNEGVIIVDSTARHIMANPAAARILSMSQEQVLGTAALDPSWRTVDEHGAPLAPENLPNVIAVRTGTATRNAVIGVFAGEDRFRWVRVNAEPFRSPGGEQFAVTTFEDVTEDRRVAAELRDKSALLEGVIDALPDHATVLERNGNVLLDNGWRRLAPDFKGETRIAPHWETLDVTLPDGGIVPLMQLPVPRAFNGEVVDNYEVRIRRRGSNDEWRHVFVSTRPLYDQHGSVERVLRLARDVTEYHKLRVAASTNERMQALGRLAGGIAHDLNNLLTATISSASLILVQDGVSPEIARLARLISEAATYGADLTRNLLSYARQRPLTPRRTNVNVLIGRTTGLLRPIIGDGIEIETDLDPSDPAALVDSAQLTTALINLATNARDAMDGKGRLLISTEVRVLNGAEWIWVSVRDTGPGVSDEIRDRIFDPFFTTKQGQGGSGLGLSMVQGFVAQSGGCIELLERNEFGAGFALILPRSKAPARRDRKKDLTLGWAPRVLVVENDRLVREALVIQLEDLECTVTAVANGAEALSLPDPDMQFDILMTDLAMPGDLDGFGIARALADRCQSIVYMSGREAPEDIKYAPPGAFLRKPFSVHDLHQVLRRREPAA